MLLRAVPVFVAFDNFEPRGGRVGPCHTIGLSDWGHEILTLMIQQTLDTGLCLFRLNRVLMTAEESVLTYSSIVRYSYERIRPPDQHQPTALSPL